MPQANAEHRHLAGKRCQRCNLRLVVGGVAGTVGEHHAVRRKGKNLFRRGGVGEDLHGAAALHQFPDDILFGAAVQQHHAVRRRLGGDGVGFLAGDRSHGVAHAVRRNFGKVHVCCVGNHRVHHALFPNLFGNRPRVHSANAGDACLLQVSIQRHFTAEVGGMLAPFPHHISACGAFALKIFGDDSVIADHREGLQNDLPCVAGVGQGLDIAAHAGGEHQLAHSGVRGAEGYSFHHLAVGKDKVALHAPAPPIMAASTALMVCIRFSASSNTTDCGPSNTPLLTSMASLPNVSHFSLPIVVFLSW